MGVMSVGNPAYHVYASVYASQAVNRVKNPRVKRVESKVEATCEVIEDIDPSYYRVGQNLDLRV
jgi:hypothetical protein